MIQKKIAIAVLLTAMTAATATAGPIISAATATINSGGPGFGSIINTINQAGLSAGYTSGVTDFDSYIASNPTHSLIFSGLEWFSEQDSTAASVTYDLGSSMNIDALALWNEESSGITALDLLGSTDGVSFFNLSMGLAPVDNSTGSDYSAEVFSFANTALQYVRFDMSGCPQPTSSFNACAIGEVAFRGAGSNDVPEPAPLALLGLGLLGLGLARKRRA